MIESAFNLMRAAAAYGVFRDETATAFAARIPIDVATALRALPREEIVQAFEQSRSGRYVATGPSVPIANLWLLRKILDDELEPWDQDVPNWLLSVAESEQRENQDPDYFETIEAMSGSRVLQLWLIGQRLGNGQRRERFFDVVYGKSERSLALFHLGCLLNTTEDYVLGAAGRSRVPDQLLQRYYGCQERLFLAHRLADGYSPWNFPSSNTASPMAHPDPPELDAAAALANRPVGSHGEAVRTDRELCESILRTNDPDVLQLLWLRHAMVCAEAELLIGADPSAELSDIAIRNAASICLADTG